MSSPVVGSARVEITGDLSEFAAGTKREMAQAIGKVSNEAEQGLAGIADHAGAEGEKAGTKFGAGLGAKLSGALDKVKGVVGGKLGDLGLGAALAGAFASAVGTAQNQFHLAAVLGLSPEEAKKAAKVSGQVYADNWGESMDEVNAAVVTVKQQLGDLIPPGAVKGTTELSLAFKSAFGAEPQDSIKAVAQMIRTGLVKNAAEGFDVLTKGFQNGSNKADDLLDSFNEYGTQFRKMGIDGPTALGLINQAMKGGARDSDLAADAIKEFSLRAVDGSKGTATAFKSVGLNAKTMSEDIGAGGDRAKNALGATLTALRNIKDPVQQAQAAAALFGSQAEDLGGALYALNPATAATSKGMEGLKGSSQAMSDNLSKSAPPLEVLKRQVMGAFTSLASHLVPIINKVSPLIAKLGPEITVLAVAFGAMIIVTKMAKAVKAFNLMLAESTAVQKLSAVATKVSTAMQRLYTTAVTEGALKQKIIMAATKAWTAAQWLFNAAMSANPVMLLVTALAALALGLYEAYKHIGPVHDAINAVGDAFAWVWHSLLEPIVDFFKKHWKQALIIAVAVFAPFIALPILIVKKWHAIVDFFKGLGKMIVGIFAGAGKWLLNFGHTLIMGLYNGAKSAWSSAWAWFKSLPKMIGNIASSLGSSFWNGLKSVVSDIGNLGKSMYNAIVDTINNGLLRPIKNWHFTIGAFGISHTFQPFGGIPTIPRLARGGMTTGPMQAMVGDNQGGNELVMPMEDPRTVGLLRRALSGAVDGMRGRLGAGGPGGGSGGGGEQLRGSTQPLMAMLSDEDRALLRAVATRPVSVQVSNREVARASNDGNRELARRSGNPATAGAAA